MTSPDSSVGVSGELRTRRRNEPRLHHCTKALGVSSSVGETIIVGEVCPDNGGVGERDLEWKKYRTFSTMERARFGLCYSFLT